MSTISLAMAVYNREAYLESAIASVLAQTCPDFKLLIWDDGSTDNSLEIAKSFLSIDPRVEVVIGKHVGASKALKCAIAQAIAYHQPKYIAWVDSDDWLHSHALELMLPVLESRPNLGVLYSDYMAIDEQGLELGISRSARIPYSKDRLLVDLMSHHFRILRTSVYEYVGGIDTNFKFNYDYQMCLRLSEVTSFEHFPQVLYKRLMHKDSITGSHRTEQIQYAKKAVEQALVRRGLSEIASANIDPVSGKIQLTIGKNNDSSLFTR